MYVTKRIRIYLDFKGITKYKFSKDAGFSNGFLDKERAIGSDKCAKILEIYTDLNPEWLLTGRGEMLRQAPPNEGEKESTEEISNLKADIEFHKDTIKNQQDTMKLLQTQIARLEEKIAAIEKSYGGGGKLYRKAQQAENNLSKSLLWRFYGYFLSLHCNHIN